ncbi:bifunctional protein FolD [Iodidimonas muriae]|uniref:Bifunctional protein FolD n=1 Tax=Iodidimonas muriae TaxID=261467 RepID=A0ABQ2LAM8_9PROT|nr:bifunctional methylenetetrahydrofolate dehydrogenase/methenyltetrahydrofolate cyclohydrolase FolD [Iodidimonas muriae]GER06118.1 bifunctional protein FolD [Kordiimonadales bacterium JCM 17843]GGO08291.1 bifunctional protein FolD [Iodidimonas muriae]
MAQLIDGKTFAANLRRTIAGQVAQLNRGHGITPGLAVVLVGNDPASEVYVRNKGRQTIEVGMQSFEHRLPQNTDEAQVLDLVARLNADPNVHGILVQLPLPDQINSAHVLAAIDPKKDVDGFHVINAGLLATGGKGLVPCTPLGCMMMLHDHLGDLSGLDAVVVGRSNIVGKPLAHLLLAANCTVTIAHSRSRDLPDICRKADILVAAVGRPRMIKGDWIKPGATVIDVGINRIPAPEKGEGKSRLVGDVDLASAQKHAGAITPVPGGVGPMTIACLLANTLTATCRIHGLDPSDLDAR